MQWLAECSVAALREARGAVAPELARYPVTVPGAAGKQDPLWHSGAVPAGDRFFVKFAWSRPAALRLAREIGVLAALAREPKVPFLPEVVTSSADPLLMITRRVPGTSLFEVAGSIDPDHAARQVVRFLAALHDPAARRRRGRRRHAHRPAAAAGHHQDLAPAAGDVDPAGSAPDRRPVVRLGRRRARLTWPGRARAR
jgi:phosphotransferase family enzyme